MVLMLVYFNVCLFVCLFMVRQAFDMQRDLQITPRRLEYTREKEAELFTSLMAIANRKQEEMKEMIVETLSTMKEQLLEDAANLEFTGVCVCGGGLLGRCGVHWGGVSCGKLKSEDC